MRQSLATLKDEQGNLISSFTKNKENPFNIIAKSTVKLFDTEGNLIQESSAENLIKDWWFKQFYAEVIRPIYNYHHDDPAVVYNDKYTHGAIYRLSLKNVPTSPVESPKTHIESFVDEKITEVGYAYFHTPYAGTEANRGTINESEVTSYMNDKGNQVIRFVFDFATDKANGTFNRIDIALATKRRYWEQERMNLNSWSPRIKTKTPSMIINDRRHGCSIIHNNKIYRFLDSYWYNNSWSNVYGIKITMEDLTKGIDSVVNTLYDKSDSRNDFPGYYYSGGDDWTTYIIQPKMCISKDGKSLYIYKRDYNTNFGGAMIGIYKLNIVSETEPTLNNIEFLGYYKTAYNYWSSYTGWDMNNAGTNSYNWEYNNSQMMFIDEEKNLGYIYYTKHPDNFSGWCTPNNGGYKAKPIFEVFDLKTLKRLSMNTIKEDYTTDGGYSVWNKHMYPSDNPKYWFVVRERYIYIMDIITLKIQLTEDTLSNCLYDYGTKKVWAVTSDGSNSYFFSPPMDGTNSADFSENEIIPITKSNVNTMKLYYEYELVPNTVNEFDSQFIEQVDEKKDAPDITLLESDYTYNINTKENLLELNITKTLLSNYLPKFVITKNGKTFTYFGKSLILSNLNNGDIISIDISILDLTTNKTTGTLVTKNVTLSGLTNKVKLMTLKQVIPYADFSQVYYIFRLVRATDGKIYVDMYRQDGDNRRVYYLEWNNTLNKYEMKFIENFIGDRSSSNWNKLYHTQTLVTSDGKVYQYGMELFTNYWWTTLWARINADGTSTSLAGNDDSGGGHIHVAEELNGFIWLGYNGHNNIKKLGKYSIANNTRDYINLPTTKAYQITSMMQAFNNKLYLMLSVENNLKENTDFFEFNPSDNSFTLLSKPDFINPTINYTWSKALFNNELYIVESNLDYTAIHKYNFTTKTWSRVLKEDGSNTYYVWKQDTANITQIFKVFNNKLFLVADASLYYMNIGDSVFKKISFIEKSINILSNFSGIEFDPTNNKILIATNGPTDRCNIKTYDYSEIESALV